jgi:hypothetical protein
LSLAPSKSKGKMIPILARNNMHMLKKLIVEANTEVGGSQYYNELLRKNTT